VSIVLAACVKTPRSLVEYVKSKRNDKFGTCGDFGPNYVKLLWTKDSMEQLIPIIPDREYLVDQHILVSVRSEDDNEVHGTSLRLLSFWGWKALMKIEQIFEVVPSFCKSLRCMENVQWRCIVFLNYESQTDERWPFFLGAVFIAEAIGRAGKKVATLVPKNLFSALLQN